MNTEETCTKDEKSCLKIHHAKEFFIKFLCVVMCCLLNFFLPRDFCRWMMNKYTKADITNRKKDCKGLKTAIIQDDSWKPFYFDGLQGFSNQLWGILLPEFFLYCGKPRFVCTNYFASKLTGIKAKQSWTAI